MEITTPGSGSGATEFVADVTPGNASPSRTGLQDFDDVTGIDGLVVFVYGGGGGNRINSGLWVMRSGAWERPSGWDAGTDITGYKVSVKGGTLYGGTSWSLARGSVLGTDQQFWDAQIKGGGNQNPGSSIGGLLTGLSTRNEYQELPHPGESGKVLTSGDPGVAPTWEDGVGGGGVPLITHVVNLSNPDNITIVASPTNLVFNTYNGYNYQTQDTENSGDTSYELVDGETIYVEPGLYQFGFFLSADEPVSGSQIVTVSFMGLDGAGVVPSTIQFLAADTLGGSAHLTGLVEFDAQSAVSVAVSASDDTHLGTCTFSFGQLEA